jgi:hypothetical protein
MKWSQATCASILVDSFCAIDGLSPRAVNREFRPNQLTPDWEFHLSPLQPGPQSLGQRVAKHRLSQSSRVRLV